MKRKLLWFLIVEAIAVALATALFGVGSETALLSVPFRQIGSGLRALSLSGNAGNLAAVCLYLLIGLVPLALFAVRAFQKRLRSEDMLLLLLCPLLFVALYLIINPAYLAQHFATTGAEFVDFYVTVANSAVCAVVVGYCLLRMLRSFSARAADKALKSLKWLVIASCAVLVLALCGTQLTELIVSWTRLSTDTTGHLTQLSLSRIFLILQFIVTALPALLDLVLLFAALDVTSALQADPYGLPVIYTARRLSSLCRRSVVIILISQISLNLLQFAFGSRIFVADYNLTIPLLSIIAVLVTLLLATYFEQNRRLKLDNDAII